MDMAPFKLGLLVLAGFTLAACQKEAGADSMFPPIGGARPMIMPEAAAPVDLTPDDPSTAALTDAVNDALTAASTVDDSAIVANTDPNTGNGMASDSGVLVLADESQAEQLSLRTADAQALAAAAAERVVIQPGQMPEVVAGVNIITFARETSNAVGERLYRRPSIRRTNSASQCRKFASADDAQRNFLANGGPQDDPLNLDPNGDGFACRWSPEAYRALVLN